MTSRTSLCLFMSLAGLVSCLVPVVSNAQDAAGRVEVAGTRVSFVPPPGFKVSSQIQGFVGPNGATIVVIELDQPFAEMSADMKRAKRVDMIILDAKPAKLENGRPATWAHLRQTYRGEALSKWMLLFGDSKTSLTITVTVPERDAPGAEKAVAQSLETVRWSPGAVTATGPSVAAPSPSSPTPASRLPSAPPTPSQAIDTAGLPFTIRLAAGFENVLRLGPTLGVGLIGTRLPDTSGSPLFLVTSEAPVTLNDLSATTMALFMGTTPDLFSQRIGQTIGPVHIGGNPAHEVVGRARHNSGYPVALYAVVIAGSPSLRIFGTCRLEDQPKYLPAFRQMAESVSLVPK